MILSGLGSLSIYVASWFMVTGRDSRGVQEIGILTEAAVGFTVVVWGVALICALFRGVHCGLNAIKRP